MTLHISPNVLPLSSFLKNSEGFSWLFGGAVPLAVQVGQEKKAWEQAAHKAPNMAQMRCA